MNKIDWLANLLTACAYYAIPIGFVILTRKNKIGMVLGKWLFYLTALFILACGTHHLCLVLEINSKIMMVVDGFMALVSTVTAIYMVILIPHVLKYPTMVEKLETRSKRLDAIIAELENG